MSKIIEFAVMMIPAFLVCICVGLAADDSVRISVGVQNDYHSFTKAIVICDRYENCVAQDFYVVCEGKYITNITALGTGVRVGAQANGIEEWC